MPRRIELCREALDRVNREQQPELWAKLHIMLSNSLARNPQRSRADNLEQAIHHYRQVLEVYTRAAFLEQWAANLVELANAFACASTEGGPKILNGLSSIACPRWRSIRAPASTNSVIAADRHTPDENAISGAIPAGNVHKYLARLVELQLVERRTPATVPPKQRTTHSRYYLRDPFLRYYYRFREPSQDLIELELKDALWQAISEQLRAFIGATAFEDLCREWTLAQARAGRLTFVPQAVSGHWRPNV